MPALESVLQEVRQEIGAIVDSEGKPIKTEEVEGAIVYLLRSLFEDYQLRAEIQEWLDNHEDEDISPSTGKSF